MATNNFGIDPEKEDEAIRKHDRAKARMDYLESEERMAPISAGIKARPASVVPSGQTVFDQPGVMDNIRAGIEKNRAVRDHATTTGEKVAAENMDVARANVNGDIARIRKEASDEVDGWFADPTQGELDEIRRKYGRRQQEPRTTAPAAAPTPVQGGGPAAGSVEQLDNGGYLFRGANGVDSLVKGGKSYTVFGGDKVRVVDQKTGATSWADLNGNSISAPVTSWQDAVARQKSNEMQKAESYAQSAVRTNRDAKMQREIRMARQNAKVGDVMGAAFDDFTQKLDAIKNSEKGAGWNIANQPGVYEKDGRYYVRGLVDKDAFATFNSDMAKNGAKDSLDGVVVSQEVDKYGNPIGGPGFSAVYSRNGNVTKNGDGTYTRQLSLGEAVDSVAKAQMKLGHPEGEARAFAVRQFGGNNPFNWDIPVTEREKFTQKTEAEVADRDIKRSELGVKRAEADIKRGELNEKIRQNEASEAQASVPSKFIEALFTGAPMLDESGQPVLDEKGNVMRKDLTNNELLERLNLLRVVRGRNGGELNDIVMKNFLDEIGGAGNLSTDERAALGLGTGDKPQTTQPASGADSAQVAAAKAKAEKVAQINANAKPGQVVKLADGTFARYDGKHWYRVN